MAAVVVVVAVAGVVVVVEVVVVVVVAVAAVRGDLLGSEKPNIQSCARRVTSSSASTWTSRRS